MYYRQLTSVLCLSIGMSLSVGGVNANDETSLEAKREKNYQSISESIDKDKIGNTTYYAYRLNGCTIRAYHNVKTTFDANAYIVQRSASCNIADIDQLSIVYVLLFQFLNDGVFANTLVLDWLEPRLLSQLIRENCSARACFESWNFNDAEKTSRKVVDFVRKNNGYLQIQKLFAKYGMELQLERMRRFEHASVSGCIDARLLGNPVQIVNLPADTIIPCQVQVVFNIIKK